MAQFETVGYIRIGAANLFDVAVQLDVVVYISTIETVLPITKSGGSRFRSTAAGYRRELKGVG